MAIIAGDKHRGNPAFPRVYRPVVHSVPRSRGTVTPVHRSVNVGPERMQRPNHIGVAIVARDVRKGFPAFVEGRFRKVAYVDVDLDLNLLVAKL